MHRAIPGQRPWSFAIKITPVLWQKQKTLWLRRKSGKIHTKLIKITNQTAQNPWVSWKINGRAFRINNIRVKNATGGGPEKFQFFGIIVLFLAFSNKVKLRFVSETAITKDTSVEMASSPSSSCTSASCSSTEAANVSASCSNSSKTPTDTLLNKKKMQLWIEKNKTRNAEEVKNNRALSHC